MEEGNIEDAGLFRWYYNLRRLIDEMCLNVGELKWRMEGGVAGVDRVEGGC